MRRTRRGVLAVFVASTLLAAGCGDDDEESATSDSTTTTAGEATEESDTEESETEESETEESETEESETEESETEESESEGSESETDGPSSEGCAATEGAVVGYSEPIPDPNFAIIEDVINSELEAAGASLQPVNAQLDPNKQVSDVQSLLQQEVDVLLINPVEPNSVQAVIADVREAGIPVIVQDTDVGGPYDGTVKADVESAATAGAEELAELADGGQVAAIFGPDFAEVLVRERETFTEAAEAAGIDLVETQVNAMITPDGAAQIASAFQQNYGEDLAGIWTFNDTSAVGVASVIGDGFEPALVSINGQPEAIPLVEAGIIDVTFDLQQDLIGRALAYSAINALCERELPEEIWVASERIDQSNVADYVPLEERVEEDVELALEERDGRSYLVDE